MCGGDQQRTKHLTRTLVGEEPAEEAAATILGHAYNTLEYVPERLLLRRRAGGFSSSVKLVTKSNRKQLLLSYCHSAACKILSAKSLRTSDPAVRGETEVAHVRTWRGCQVLLLPRLLAQQMVRNTWPRPNAAQEPKALRAHGLSYVMPPLSTSDGFHV